VTAEEKATKIKEAKSLSKSLSTEAEKSSETRKPAESKPEKRGALGQETTQEASKEGGEEGGGQPSDETEVSHHRPLVIEKVVHVHVPVPHPYPVEYVKHVPYPVKVPVPVVVHKPFPVPVPKPYHVAVEKKEPYPVVKHIPHLVKIPVEVPVKVPVEIPVHKPYTVPVPVPSPVPLPLPHPVIKPIPLFIKQHPDSQEIYKQEIYEGSQHGVSAPETHKVSIPEDNYGVQAQSDDVKVYNIPKTYRLNLLEMYRDIVPETNYGHPSIPELSQYQNYPEQNEQSSPEAYSEPQSAGISSHEFSIFGDHKGHLNAGLEDSGYLNHDHGEEGHGFSYQRFKTC
jgi:hypothetical protein